MSGMSNEKVANLMETVSFELDTDLRLHPQKLELGKAELLTDALTLPFMDIEKRLNQYITGQDSDEKIALQRSIKAYLAKLNSNPLIPLHHRLKVLKRFEEELELFDAEMTAAVLNAHKIGVDLVRQAAQNESAYHRILVDMVSNALELAVKMLRIGLEKYQAPAVLTTRQSFDLMRLGLSVIPVLEERDVSEKTRLFKAVGNHEMMRMLDFFGKTPQEQKIVWRELQHHIQELEPVFVYKDEPLPKLSGSTFMITQFSRPNEAASILSKLPARFNIDSVLIPADNFIDRLVTAIGRVETVLQNPDLQHNDLHTEEALHGTITGGNAILNTMRSRQRSSERKKQGSSKLMVEWNAPKALQEANIAASLDQYEFAPAEGSNPDSWSIIDMSDDGIGIERLAEYIPKSAVGSLVGLSWIPHNGEPLLGIVRWLKEPKPGEQRMGIKFFQHEFKNYKGTIVGGGTEEMSNKRSWPVLVKAGKKFHTALFPDCRVFRNMVFLLTQDGKGAHFKVIKVTKGGPNYCMCDIVPANLGTK